MRNVKLILDYFLNHAQFMCHVCCRCVYLLSSRHLLWTLKNRCSRHCRLESQGGGGGGGGTLYSFVLGGGVPLGLGNPYPIPDQVQLILEPYLD